MQGGLNEKKKWSSPEMSLHANAEIPPMNRFPIRREKGRIPLCTGIALLAQNRQGLNCHRMDEHGTPIPPPSDGMHVPKGHRGRPGHSRCPERAFLRAEFTIQVQQKKKYSSTRI